MKDLRIRAVLSAIGIMLFMFLFYPMFTRADGCDLPPNPWGEPFLIESTAYCDRGITASGSQVREGIIAGKKEWLGKQAVLYTIREDGLPEYLGIYEFKDTGGDYRIKNGTCLDIWMPTEAECIEWGRRQIFVQIIDGKG